MKRIAVVAAIGMALALAGCGKEPGPAGPKGKPGRKDRQGHRALKAGRAFLGLKVSRDRRAVRGPKATRGTLGRLALEFGPYRRMARSVVKPTKRWCQCSVQWEGHQTAR